MNHKEFNAALDKLGYDQQVAADVLGVNYRTIGRWRDRERRVPTWVQILLRLLISGKINTQEIRKARS